MGVSGSGRSKVPLGVPPRHLVWVLKGSLAMSERPGGQGYTHRRLRRTEEISWLLANGFNRVVSLLPSPHNLHCYKESGMCSAHMPLAATSNFAEILPPFYAELRGWLNSGEVVLVHHEEMGELVLGFCAGYLLWSGKLRTGPQAVVAVETLAKKPMGPLGRSMVAALEGAM